MRQEDREEFARLYSSSPEVIGDWGEIITASEFRSSLNLRVIRSLYVGKSQIDMVAISEAGVRVIENKNIHGVVAGLLSERYWQLRYTPYRAHAMYSPVMQNNVHVKDVKAMLMALGYEKVPVFSSVIFNDGTDLRVNVKEDRLLACTLSGFVKAYKECKPPNVITSETCVYLEDLFRKFQDSSNEARESHVNRIKQKCEGMS